MRLQFLFILSLVCVLSAFGGTRPLVPPEPAVSTVDASGDTMLCGVGRDVTDVSIDTMLMGWALSPWPGIRLNTKPVKGLILVVQ